MTACVLFPSKARYESKAAAKLAKRRMRWAQMRDNIQPYRCPACGSFHLGHKPGAARESWGSAA